MKSINVEFVKVSKERLYSEIEKAERLVRKLKFLDFDHMKHWLNNLAIDTILIYIDLKIIEFDKNSYFTTKEGKYKEIKTEEGIIREMYESEINSSGFGLEGDNWIYTAFLFAKEKLKGNSENTHLAVKLSAKSLGSRYLEGINKSNFNIAFKDIQTACQFRVKKEFVKDLTDHISFSDVDIKRDRINSKNKEDFVNDNYRRIYLSRIGDITAYCDDKRVTEREILSGSRITGISSSGNPVKTDKTKKNGIRSYSKDIEMISERHKTNPLKYLFQLNLMLQIGGRVIEEYVRDEFNIYDSFDFFRLSGKKNTLTELFSVSQYEFKKMYVKRFIGKIKNRRIRKMPTLVDWDHHFMYADFIEKVERLGVETAYVNIKDKIKRLIKANEGADSIELKVYNNKRNKAYGFFAKIYNEIKSKENNINLDLKYVLADMLEIKIETVEKLIN